MADWLADRLAALGFESYDAYLASAHWRRVRRRIERAVPARCVVCGTTRRVELHHRHYFSLGNEGPDAVEWRCRKHHLQAHGRAA
jgi:hypothetical protein